MTNPNGTWTLRFRDGNDTDTGSVSSGALEVRTGADSTAPSTPSFTGTVPSSPSSSNQPRIKGSADPDSIVRLYVNDPFCSSTALLAAAGTAADFAGSGIRLPVDSDAETSIYASAYDGSGNVSGCTGVPLVYAEDSINPITPTLAAVDPPSPANVDSVLVTGSTDDDTTADADTDVNLYGSADCSPPPAATGTEEELEAAGISVDVPINETVEIRATATDLAGNVSGCSAPISFTEDSTSAAPTFTGFDPTSPANNNTPKLKGSGAEALSSIQVYLGSICTGPGDFFGTAAEFNGAGIDLAVADNTTQPFVFEAIDLAGNISACSSPITYTEDSVALAPALTGTDPVSGSNENSPRIKGSAEAGSAVELFTTSDCTGAPAATGTAAELGASGIAVSVADDSITEIRAVATDPVGNLSACSAPISYTESTSLSGPVLDLTPPQTSIGSKPKATVKTKGRSASYSVSFSANEPATFRCSLDGAPFAACTSPATGKAKKGSHTFSVIATDAAGNADPTAATASWKVKRKKRKH